MTQPAIGAGLIEHVNIELFLLTYSRRSILILFILAGYDP